MLYISTNTNEPCFLAPIRTPSPHSEQEDDNKTLTYEDEDELEEMRQWASQEEEPHLAAWRTSWQAGHAALHEWLEAASADLSQQEIDQLEGILSQ